MKKENDLLKQVCKFLIVGGIATLIDWGIYIFLNGLLKINPLISNIFSFSISVIYNYLASIKWVFKVSKNKSSRKIFIDFLLLSVLGLILSEFFMWFFIEKLRFKNMFSKILSTGLVMIFNFITRKYFLEDNH